MSDTCIRQLWQSRTKSRDPTRISMSPVASVCVCVRACVCACVWVCGSVLPRPSLSDSLRVSWKSPTCQPLLAHVQLSSVVCLYVHTHTCIICLYVHTHMYHLLACIHTHVSSACMYTRTCIICLYVHTRARAGTAYTNTHRKCGSQGALRLDSWLGILQVAPVCVRARIRVCSSMRVCLRTCTHGHKEYLLPGGISGAVAWIALTQLT